ncbi:hypothetical protein SAMN05216368_11639 [Cryobacterium flavum]|uniref:Uncharacterized protein n=1 Tax=Cryobacterium flavum TaxID=1424659 RepID=A0A4R8V967_9MICO|nr:hypothetical protein E3O21_06290 [Cryobacterium flavum]TFB78558.1 hypothetical protein E3O21_05465 [Cryobacterium flavum]SDO37119.1 hypothetical protein SAMN05216368_11639 [Cryobacterium flavum]
MKTRVRGSWQIRFIGVASVVTASLLTSSVTSTAAASASPQSAGIQASSAQLQKTIATVDKTLGKSPGLVSNDAETKETRVIAGVAPGAPHIEASGDAAYAMLRALSADSIVKQSGSQQSLITVLEKGNIAEFELSLPIGFEPSIQPDGSVDLKSESGTLTPFIEVPWALDANGTRVQTSYTIVGDILQQTIAIDGAEFPIVADPSIQWIPFPVIAAWGYEWEAVVKALGTIAVASAGAGCALTKVPSVVLKVFKALCGVVGVNTAKDTLAALGNLWGSSINRDQYTCWSIPIGGFNSTTIREMPAADCA